MKIKRVKHIDENTFQVIQSDENAKEKVLSTHKTALEAYHAMFDDFGKGK